MFCDRQVVSYSLNCRLVITLTLEIEIEDTSCLS